jgi:sulfur-carrier protein adenylyltransferase/sulfurtransferase
MFWGRKIKSVSHKDLESIMKNDIESLELVDVRNHSERQEKHIGGLHIPLQEIPERVHEIPKDKRVIVYCKRGGRSLRAIEWLENNYNFENLYNLEGGIDAR